MGGKFSHWKTAVVGFGHQRKYFFCLFEFPNGQEKSRGLGKEGNQKKKKSQGERGENKENSPPPKWEGPLKKEGKGVN